MVHYWDEAQTILPLYPPRRSFQPGKKTILIAVLLSFLLVMSQIFCSLRLNKPTKLSVISLHQGLDMINELIEPPPCLKNFLGNVKPPPKPPETCHHIVPPRGICSLISELFYDKSPATCSYQKKVEFCKKINGIVKCEIPKECLLGNLSIGLFDSTVGKIIWSRLSSTEELNKGVLSALNHSSYKGFVFIQCSDLVQLFLSPPHQKRSEIADKNSMNFNFIMIDSLSRNHFFRSLPKSVDYLSDLVSLPQSNVKVLDFEFVQSVKQRTYESLQALFTGFVDIHHKPFNTLDNPNFPLPLEFLLDKFKKRNYRTLWLEDLCFAWEWGLAKDLKVVNQTLGTSELWVRFREAYKKAGIDDVDLTLASCQILKHNDRNDPFHNTPAVCLNGKYHHEYQFDYLKKYQLTNQDQNLFTFTQTNVAHDETGVRVQSLDKSLQEYLRFASTKLKNTMTIVFSDHGNTYGKFLEKSSEAYIETFNPFLFIIIPMKVREKINDLEFRVLEDNQKNLITLIDVHEMLLGLINATNNERKKKNKNLSFREKYSVPRGLLSNIRPLRTCSDLPLLMPNLCICQNFDVSVPISSKHRALVEFSVGVLNNFIISQRHRSGMRGYGNCQILVHRNIRSAKEVRLSADVISYKLDVEVSGINSDESENFFFNVEVGSGEPSVRLISYERLSLYSKFTECKDSGVELKLCVCDSSYKKSGVFQFFKSLLLPNWWIFGGSDNDESMEQIHKFLQHQPESSEIIIDKVYPKKDSCLYVIRHDYESSFNIFVINFCESFHKVTIDFSLTNVALSDNLNSKHLVRPLDVRILICGTKLNPSRSFHWSNSISIL